MRKLYALGLVAALALVLGFILFPTKPKPCCGNTFPTSHMGGQLGQPR